MNTSIISIDCNKLYNGIEYNGVITLFTPTYQRAIFLHRIYDCLLNQTSKRFAWIIVNDGSTDETDEVCEQIVTENKIPVLYIQKENGGKHSAFKVAFEACKTEFFQCMDDDDIYSERAVETYLKAWSEIGNQKDIGAIRTIAKYQNGRFAVAGCDINSKIGTYEDCSTLEMNYIRNCRQENWTCYRTMALREIDLFPEEYWLADKHKFFSEGIWQGRFARKFKCRYLYIPLRAYSEDAEFSIIRSKKTYNYYLNMFINSKIILDEHYDYISKSPMRLFRRVIIVQLLRKYLGINQHELISNTKSNTIKLLYTLSYPFSIFGKIIINSRIK